MKNKIALIADTVALGLMEAKPEPAWKVRLSALRNKELIAPDYGAMYVVSYLNSRGFEIEVINALLDVNDQSELFRESKIDPEDYSDALISKPEALQNSRSYLFDRLNELDPDVILFPLSVYNLARYTRKLLVEIRKSFPGKTIIAGGIYASFHPVEILQDGGADIVVRGEGEITSEEILRALDDGKDIDNIAGISFIKKGQIVHNPGREPLNNLDILPHLYESSDNFKIRKRYELLTELNPDDDYIPGCGFLTSRGCPESCTFCLDPAINKGKTRFHSPQYVKNVLEFCSKHYSDRTDTFFFGDATFTMNRKRLYRILELIRDFPFKYQIQTRADYLDETTIRNLAECRFTTVAIGAESLNEKILNEVVNKRLNPQTVIDVSLAVRKAGMQPVLTFIVGLPGESKESVLRTVEILLEKNLTTATFFPLVVFRGTALFEEFLRRFSPEEREILRLNPASEEFLFLNEYFSSRDELTDFTAEVNRKLIEARVRI